MRDEQQRAVERLDGLLDPFTRGEVKVVGRLVENEQIERIVHQLAQAPPESISTVFIWVSPVNWNAPRRFRATCMETFLS